MSGEGELEWEWEVTLIKWLATPSQLPHDSHSPLNSLSHSHSQSILLSPTHPSDSYSPRISASRKCGFPAPHIVRFPTACISGHPQLHEGFSDRKRGMWPRRRDRMIMPSAHQWFEGETLVEHFESRGIPRREFLEFCGKMAV